MEYYILTGRVLLSLYLLLKYYKIGKKKKPHILPYFSAKKTKDVLTYTKTVQSALLILARLTLQMNYRLFCTARSKYKELQQMT